MVHITFDLPPRVMRAVNLMLLLLLLVGGFIIVRGLLRPYENCEEEKKKPHEIVHVDPGDLMKEYELSQEMHNYYGHLTWQIASILVGGSIAGLALVISSRQTPKVMVSIFALAVTGGAFAFWLFMRRYGKIAEKHLERCREIEECLGMKQHSNVKEAKPPWPTGWGIVQGLCWGLMIFGIVVALCYLLPTI